MKIKVHYCVVDVHVWGMPVMLEWLVVELVLTEAWMQYKEATCYLFCLMMLCTSRVLYCIQFGVDDRQQCFLLSNENRGHDQNPFFG